jgi:hypothetical protein
VTLLQNPSHLEAIDPVVVGKVRAKQLEGAVQWTLIRVSPSGLPGLVTLRLSKGAAHHDSR